MSRGQGRQPVLQSQAGQGGGGGDGGRGTAREMPPLPLVPGSAGHKRESRGSQIHPWLSPPRAGSTITVLSHSAALPKVLQFKCNYLSSYLSDIKTDRAK